MRKQYNNTIQQYNKEGTIAEKAPASPPIAEAPGGAAGMKEIELLTAIFNIFLLMAH